MFSLLYHTIRFYVSFVSNLLDVMKLLQGIIITIYLSGLSSKKRRKDVSSESIENILYYQDCNHHKQMPQQPTPLAAQRPLPQQQQQCKMCCTMCCGDQCVDSHQQLQHQPGRQLFNGQVEPKGMGMIQPGRIPPKERRKKEFPLPMKPPLPGRRGMGFTRENIKSLIARDEDIKKILKDLVRVTMQKVDLMQMLEQPGVGAVPVDSPPPADVSASQNDL